MEVIMRKSDFKFIIIIIVAAVIIWGVTQGLHKEGGMVSVSVDGEEIASYSLAEPLDIMLAGNGEGGNRLVIEDGKASITEADCPDELCVRQKAVSKDGESIICLPHKLVLTVAALEAASYDSIAN